MAKSIFDYMSEEDYNEYNAIQERAKAAKAAAPKAPRERKPLTIEQKAEAAKKRVAALEAKVKALLEAQTAAPVDGE